MSRCLDCVNVRNFTGRRGSLCWSHFNRRHNAMHIAGRVALALLATLFVASCLGAFGWCVYTALTPLVRP